MSKFNDSNYQALNLARWQALDDARLFTDFSGVKVLDLGAGDGVFSDTYFTPKAAIVTPVEARDENLLAMQRDRPTFAARAKKANLETVFPSGKWDMVLCVGLLYHLETPAQLLASCAKAAPVLFLETVIWQTPDEGGLLIVDETNSYDQAYSGRGCRPGIQWLDAVLSSLYSYVYTVPTPKHEVFNGGNPHEQRVIRVASKRAYGHLKQV